MKEKEILEKGYVEVAGNLYEKDGVLYVQHAGEIKEASELTEEQLRAVTSVMAYNKMVKKLGKEKEPKEEEKEEKNGEGKQVKPVVIRPTVHPVAQPMEIVAPQVDVKKALEVFNKFTEFKQKLLSRDDYLYIGKDGKPTTKEKAAAEYIKKSGWRKFSTVFNLNCQLLNKSRETYEDPEGIYYVWTYAVRVTAPNGRFQDAEGVATSRDPFFTKGGKQRPEEKNIMLKAQTIGFNRAISDLVGGGAKTAEEAE